MDWHRNEPCATCPYRRETKKALWHRSEFERLREQNGQQFGSIFQCHSDAKLPVKERSPCIGWVLDQKEQGIPCLTLRMHLSTNDAAVDVFNALSRDGLDLYDSVEEMIEANYPERGHDDQVVEAPVRTTSRLARRRG